jgi:hypothetical protein
MVDFGEELVPLEHCLQSGLVRVISSLPAGSWVRLASIVLLFARYARHLWRTVYRVRRPRARLVSSVFAGMGRMPEPFAAQLADDDGDRDAAEDHCG